MPFRLRLLGSPRLEADGRVTELALDRPASLAYYLIGRGSWVRRDELAYLYNPDADEHLAFGNLRKLLHRLKQRDWAQALEADQSRVRLLVACDVQEFRLLLGQKRFAQALELYSGSFLQGLSFPDLTGYETWLELERQELAQMWRNAVLEYTRVLESNGDYAQSERWLRPLLRLDPLDEEVLQALLQVLLSSGDRARAIDLYEEFRQQLSSQLSAEPLEVTRTLADQLRGHQRLVMPDSARAKHNLPAPTTRFVGRVTELEELRGHIERNRLVTLLGLGGTGKTRLALETAWAHVTTFRSGVWFVPLAGVASPDQVLPAVAQALGLDASASAEPKLQLQQHLRDQHLLLVLDNAEHLIEVALPIEALLEAAPELHVLVTSRIALELRGEHLFDVDGLLFPNGQTDEKAEDFDAVKLFLERAAQLSSTFTITPATVSAVADITRKVQGLPLALELAATWTRSLSPLEIARALGQDLSLLTARGRNVPDRHRSIGAVFDYSWARLSVAERDAMAGLSVFVDGFTLEAAEHVAGAHLPLLLGLMNHSLVRRSRAGRFDLHELVRQYADAKLNDGFRQAIGQRFVAYFADLLQLAWRERGPSHQRSLLGIKPELSNVLLAWRWMIQGLEYPLLRPSLEALHEYFLYFTPPVESQRLLTQALRDFLALENQVRPEDSLEYRFCLGKLHQGCGVFDYLSAQHDAVEQFQAALACFTQIAEQSEQSRTLDYLSQIEMFGGQYAAARGLAHQALELAQVVQADLLTAQALNTLGGISIFERKYREAIGFLEPALRLFEDSNLQIEAIGPKINLAEAHGLAGDFEAARGHLKDVIERCKHVQANKLLIAAQLTLSRVYFLERDFERVIETHHEIRSLSVAYFLTGDPYLFIGAGISHRELGQLDQSLKVLLDGAQSAKMQHKRLEIMLELAHSLTFVGAQRIAVRLVAHCLEFAPNDSLERVARDLLGHFSFTAQNTPDAALEPALHAQLFKLMNVQN